MKPIKLVQSVKPPQKERRLGERRLEFGDAWRYAPAPEATDHVRLQSRYGLFIGGRFVEPSRGRYFETVNPATERTIAEIAEASQEDIERAVSAARRAQQRV